MKKKFILNVIFVLIMIHSFGQENYRVDLLNLATISFPSEPDFGDTLGQKIFSYSDEYAHYLALTNDLSKQNGFKLKEGEIEEFYNGTIDGIIGASKGKLVSKKQFTLNGLKGVEIEYTSSINPNLPDLRFQRILFFNNTLFSINFWTISENRIFTQKERKKFFDSFTVIADKEKLEQFTISKDDAVYNIAYGIGRILGFLMVVGILVGIIFLIKNGIKSIKGRLR